MRVVYVTDRGRGGIKLVPTGEGLILRGGEIDARWAPTDCVWLVPTWAPPTPDPE